MLAVRLALPALALILFAAHVFRAFGPWPAVVALSLPGLLLVRAPWAARTLAITLGLAALEWLRTLMVLASARGADGLPWLRLAIILGVVIVLTAGAIFVLRSAPIRRYFGMS
jgi:hypothetical protein